MLLRGEYPDDFTKEWRRLASGGAAETTFNSQMAFRKVWDGYKARPEGRGSQDKTSFSPLCIVCSMPAPI